MEKNRARPGAFKAKIGPAKAEVRCWSTTFQWTVARLSLQGSELSPRHAILSVKRTFCDDVADRAIDLSYFQKMSLSLEFLGNALPELSLGVS
jgi:hypothetical protein